MTENKDSLLRSQKTLQISLNTHVGDRSTTDSHQLGRNMNSRQTDRILVQEN